MPCSNRKARKLLKENKANIINYNPFTIQLLYFTGETRQEINVGVDTGAKYIGIAITSYDKILAKGEIELRQDISSLLITRSALRGSRRNRKTRYRKARWLNRKRPLGWVPPSVQSKLNSTFMWIDRFVSLVPNAQLSIEVGKFDIAKMINPNIEGDDYQNGDTCGYYNVRYFVFARDNYTCQVCKKKNKILNTHHILYRTIGGTNRANNLITVCTDCHTAENHKCGGVLHNWMLKKKKVKRYKEATFMNIVRKRIFEKYPNAKITYGSETSPKRKKLQLNKTHYNDAIAICGINQIKLNIDDYFYYRQFRKKKRSLHEATPRKGLSKKNTSSFRNTKNVKFRNGYHLNDKVKFEDQIGWISGFSSKECFLRDINGEIIKTKRRKNNINVNMKEIVLVTHNNGWICTNKVSK